MGRFFVSGSAEVKGSANLEFAARPKKRAVISIFSIRLYEELEVFAFIWLLYALTAAMMAV